VSGLGSAHQQQGASLENVQNAKHELVSAKSFATNLEYDIRHKVLMNYISSAVHDIATPLATTQLCVDVLIDDPGVDVGTPQYDLLQKLSLSTELAQVFVRRSLDVERTCGNGDFTPTVKRVDIRNTFARCVQVADLSSHGREAINVSMTIDPNLPAAIQTDETWISDMVVDLLLNARKFTQCGTIELVVTLIQDPSKGPLLRIAVADTGRGVSAAARMMEVLALDCS